jgi:hypothetical protein
LWISPQALSIPHDVINRARTPTVSFAAQTNANASGLATTL